MHSGKTKLLTVFLMLLVFAGQATASMTMPGQTAMPCQMDMNDSSGMTMMSDMDHSTSSEAMDCCDQECSCPMGSCTSIASTTPSMMPANKIYPTRFIQNPSMVLIQTLPSLYRPPILG